MVSNVARLTRSLRDSLSHLELDPEDGASPAAASGAGSFAPRAGFTNSSLADKLSIVRRELLQSGEAIFTDDRGNRFRIERKPA